MICFTGSRSAAPHTAQANLNRRACRHWSTASWWALHKNWFRRGDLVGGTLQTQDLPWFDPFG
jgi:hypothetical protein